MKKFFIFFCISIIAMMAFFDARNRFEELDSVAANTPSQVEMKQMINRPDQQMNQDIIQDRKNIQTLNEKMKQNNNATKQNQLDNVDKRRETIKNPIN